MSGNEGAHNGVLSRTVVTILGSVAAAAVVGGFVFAITLTVANARTEGAVQAVSRSVDDMDDSLAELRQQLIRQDQQVDQRILRLEDRVRDLERGR